MGENSKIQWTDHTWNPWWGCEKVSPACANCYAETFAKRVGLEVWGAGKDRKEWTEKNWRMPFKWNEAAKQADRRASVFCASMADIFEDHPTANALRPRALEIREACNSLHGLLLTKRPENIKRMVPTAWLRSPLPNVWYGVTGETQGWAAERVSRLLLIPAAGRFLSMEPLLDRDMKLWKLRDPSRLHSSHEAEIYPLIGLAAVEDCDWSIAKLHWVIIGGESGGRARLFSVPAAKRLIGDCQAAGVPIFLKQLGTRPAIDPEDTLEGWPTHVRRSTGKCGGQIILTDAAGADWDEWHPSLRVRDYPVFS